MISFSCLRSYLKALVLVGILSSRLFCYGDLASDTLYLTWQRSPTSTMTIQWISLQDQTNDVIEYRKLEDPTWQTATGSHFPFPQGATYLIHRLELTELLPQTTYLFRFVQTDQEYRFRTMPQELDAPVRFVSGGDMYHDGIELMKETSRQAAKLNPSFALIGGDIAYSTKSVRSPQVIEKWIDWVKAWHECMVTEDKRLIPVISAIGNHDLSGHYDQTPEQAKIFSSLFPMPGDQIYNVLDFGSYLSIFILDSGHANAIEGVQTEWLKTNLKERKDVQHRIAIYHVPAYPSVRPFNNKQSQLIRRHWVPLFETGRIELALEHHDHAYKRTHNLLNNRVNSKGIVYVGDGAWGVAQPRRRFFRKPYYLAHFAAVRHFITVTLSPEETTVLCLDSRGRLVDECGLNTKDAEISTESDKQDRTRR